MQACMTSIIRHTTHCDEQRYPSSGGLKRHLTGRDPAVRVVCVLACAFNKTLAGAAPCRSLRVRARITRTHAQKLQQSTVVVHYSWSAYHNHGAAAVPWAPAAVIA